MKESILILAFNGGNRTSRRDHFGTDLFTATLFDADPSHRSAVE